MKNKKLLALLVSVLALSGCVNPGQSSSPVGSEPTPSTPAQSKVSAIRRPL